MNRVVAFLPGFATDASRGLDIGTIPGDRITDLIYCFAGFQQQASGWAPTFPEPDDTHPGKKHNIAKLVALKTRWPALNIVMSIGGWNHSHQDEQPGGPPTPDWTAVAASEGSRQAFVAACIATFIEPSHPPIGPLFGGIDLDWEYPSTSQDRANFTLLLQEFRSQLDSAGKTQGRQLTLSNCWGAGSGYQELSQQAQFLDWFNVMTYRAHVPVANPGGANQFTDVGSPLYPSPNEPASAATWTIDEVVTAFLNAGVPAQKLVIGINAYAHYYLGVPAGGNSGLYQPYSGPGPGDRGVPGFLEYKNVVQNFLPSYEYHFDDITKSSYLYDPGSQSWIWLESADSIAARAAYADEKGLAGLLLWELSADALSDLNQPSPPLPALIDAMPRGVSGFANTTLLHEPSSSAPSLAFAGGLLFLAARKPDQTQRLRVSLSRDNGASFVDTYESEESSDAAPVLAALNGTLMIAWKGVGNNQLNVAQVVTGNDAQGHLSIQGFGNKVTLAVTTDHAPALAAHAGSLFLAWKEAGVSNLQILTSSDGGATFGDAFVLDQTSDVGPALGSHNGQLMIAWKGTAKDVIVAEVALTGNSSGGFTIQGLMDNVTLFDTTDNAPVLASDGRRLFVAWTGTGDFHPQLKFSTDNGATFGGQFISTEQSDAAPALASDGSQVPIAWKSRGDNGLNVAQLAFF